MPTRTTIGFDTNPVNLLLDDPDGRNVLTAIRLGYDVILPALTFEEILSVPTSLSDRREELVGLCEKLVNHGMCLFPFHWILVKLFEAHHKSPSDFDWNSVPVQAHAYENAIRTRDFTEVDCAENRRAQIGRVCSGSTPPLTNAPENEACGHHGQDARIICDA
jgi:hypothetical protein